MMLLPIFINRVPDTVSPFLLFAAEVLFIDVPLLALVYWKILQSVRVPPLAFCVIAFLALWAWAGLWSR